MSGRCACGDWDCPVHGNTLEEAVGQLCKHCDKLIHRRQGTWVHINGTEFCHMALDGDRAEPR
jgi:hypothetical protein